MERIGRGLSSSTLRTIELPGTRPNRDDALHGQFVPNRRFCLATARQPHSEIRQNRTGHLERDGNLYSFTTIDSTGWRRWCAAEIRAYKPVRDLIAKIALPAAWLIAYTLIVPGCWKIHGKGRSSAKNEREVVFNENILANADGHRLGRPDSRIFFRLNKR